MAVDKTTKDSIAATKQQMENQAALAKASVTAEVVVPGEPALARVAEGREQFAVHVYDAARAGSLGTMIFRVCWPVRMRWRAW